MCHDFILYVFLAYLYVLYHIQSSNLSEKKKMFTSCETGKNVKRIDIYLIAMLRTALKLSKEREDQLKQIHYE